VQGWFKIDTAAFGGRTPKRWELKVAQETANRRNMRGTLRAMARLQRSSKGVSSGKGDGSVGSGIGGGSGGGGKVGGAGTGDLAVAMPTQADVLEPTRFSGPMQKVHEFSALVPPVDIRRHYTADGTCSSVVLQTYYTSECVRGAGRGVRLLLVQSPHRMPATGCAPTHMLVESLRAGMFVCPACVCVFACTAVAPGHPCCPCCTMTSCCINSARWH
jgi:hypothetical protein